MILDIPTKTAILAQLLEVQSGSVLRSYSPKITVVLFWKIVKIGMNKFQILDGKILTGNFQSCTSNGRQSGHIAD